MKRKTFLSHGAKSEQMALQITSMADVFVIILVFLLKSYSVEGLPYEPSVPVNPPVAQGRFESADALKLEVSKNTLALGGKRLAPMDGFRFRKADVSVDGSSRTLTQALSRELGSASASKTQASPRLIVVADEGAPYETLKTVLASAATAGFANVQLAVSHAN